MDIRVAEGLRRRGVNATTAVEEGKLGVPDREQFAYAAKVKAVIFTHDPHFIEIANKMKQEGKDHYGVVFVDIHRLSLGECIKQLTLYAELLSPEDMINRVEFL